MWMLHRDELPKCTLGKASLNFKFADVMLPLSELLKWANIVRT